MFYSVDLGGSTVDILRFQKKSFLFVCSLESDQVNKSNLEDIFQKAKINPKDAEKIVLTGGHSRKFKNEYSQIPLEIVSEIDAIGAGGLFLSKLPSGLVCSLGTGTCFVSAQAKTFRHVGGTGVGGGTFLGLSRTLLGTDVFEELRKLAEVAGNNSNVDILVEEIVGGGGIGMVPGSATAANFAKASFKNSKSDIARGIANMVGQTIASLAIFAARSEKHQKIILGGKLIRLPQIGEIAKKTADIYGHEIIVPKYAEFMSAIGAGILNE